METTEHQAAGVGKELQKDWTHGNNLEG